MIYPDHWRRESAGMSVFHDLQATGCSRAVWPGVNVPFLALFLQFARQRGAPRAKSALSRLTKGCGLIALRRWLVLVPKLLPYEGFVRSCELAYELRYVINALVQRGTESRPETLAPGAYTERWIQPVLVAVNSVFCFAWRGCHVLCATPTRVYAGVDMRFVLWRCSRLTRSPSGLRLL